MDIYVETDLKNGSFNLSDLNLEFSFSAALSLPAAVRPQLSMQMLDCGDFLALNLRKHAGAVGEANTIYFQRIASGI